MGKWNIPERRRTRDRTRNSFNFWRAIDDRRHENEGKSIERNDARRRKKKKKTFHRHRYSLNENWNHVVQSRGVASYRSDNQTLAKFFSGDCRLYDRHGIKRRASRANCSKNFHLPLKVVKGLRSVSSHPLRDRRVSRRISGESGRVETFFVSGSSTLTPCTFVARRKLREYIDTRNISGLDFD